MQGEREATNHFTKEMIDAAVRLWARSSISLIDVRCRLIQPDKPLERYKLPTSTLVYTQGGMASIKLDGRAARKHETATALQAAHKIRKKHKIVSLFPPSFALYDE